MTTKEIARQIALRLLQEHGDVLLTDTHWVDGETARDRLAECIAGELLLHSGEEPEEEPDREHDGKNCGCKSFDDCPGR